MTTNNDLTFTIKPIRATKHKNLDAEGLAIFNSMMIMDDEEEATPSTVE
jgi:hypothetical protein